VPSKLAGELVKFDSGHALIARLVGEELARNNCSVGEVEELINNAKGRAEALITQYINKLFKVDETSDTTKEAIVKVFALRRPFVSWVRPGDPILTPGIVELMGVSKLSGWLAIRQHDLIEEAIGKLLDCVGDKGEGCEVLGDAPKPWKTIGVMETLSEVSEKVSDEDGAVEYFASNYGEKLTNTLKLFSNCWKRAALIIGYASAGRPIVPRPEDLPESLRKDFAESLGDALNRCSVDDYLLVGNKIPPLIWYLIRNYVRVLTKAIIDKYDEVVAEVRKVLGIARGRGISGAEGLYGLGLVSIIANATDAVKPSDANAVLRIASFAIQRVVSADLIRPILDALEPLRDKAPLGYLKLLTSVSDMANLDRDTVGYIFKELNEILNNYGDVVKGHALSLVNAIHAYANLLGKHLVHFNSEDVEIVVRKIADLLNELDRFKSSLGDIAWAYALAPALIHGDVRKLMMKTLRINDVNEVVDKANEVLGRLSKLRGLIQELMRDEEFMGYVESRFVKADEEAVKTVILEASSHLKHALAIYRLDNDELNEAEDLFKEAADESREIGDYENYLISSGLALRVEAIKDPLAGDKLINGFRQLYEETFKEPFEYTAEHLSFASHVLGNYLVSLALINNVEEIRKLLEKHLWVLNADEQASILTRLTLNALLGHRVELSSELKGKLNVNPEELIDAFEEMYSEFLPALNSAIERLRWMLIDRFRDSLIERVGWLKGLGVNADKLLNMFDEFMKLVSELDGKSLAQLIAPTNSMAQLALMLHALVNGDGKLTKAHALNGAMGAIYATNKLLTKLFLEAYETCRDLGSEGCDLKNDEFRRAVARLFFYHV
jgi:hypothetical protein